MTHFSAAKRRGRSAALWGTGAAGTEALQAWVKPEVDPPNPRGSAGFVAESRKNAAAQFVLVRELCAVLVGGRRLE
ncbi:MAG: hypothetical protein ACKOHM_10260, partial [Spartobacteria bacterium]